MKVCFSTVRRKRPVPEGGELAVMDWDSQTILHTRPMRPEDPDIADDPNPRGNSRGGKGIFVHNNEIFAATYHTILVFSPDLRLKRRIANPLFVNIHEITRDDDSIWVSSTAIDAAVQTDPLGATLKTWWPREEPALQEAFGLQPMILDKSADNRLIHLHAELSAKPHHTHLNSVFKYNSRVFALLNKQGAVVQIEPFPRLLFQLPDLRGGHSPQFTPDGQHLLVCDSQRRRLLILHPENQTPHRAINLTDFPEINELLRRFPDQPFNRSIFARGLAIRDNQRILMGVSPASLIELDFQNRRLLKIFQYSRDVGDAIHGLAILN